MPFLVVGCRLYFAGSAAWYTLRGHAYYRHPWRKEWPNFGHVVLEQLNHLLCCTLEFFFRGVLVVWVNAACELEHRLAMVGSVVHTRNQQVRVDSGESVQNGQTYNRRDMLFPRKMTWKRTGHDPRPSTAIVEVPPDTPTPRRGHVRPHRAVT